VTQTVVPELVAPAGDLEKMRVALTYGADAVYLAGEEFGLRSRSRNFTDMELVTAVDTAHRIDRRVYATVNLFANDSDLFLAGIGVDALIVADPGVLAVVKDTVPSARVHLSTQANVTNVRAVEFWAERGVDRVILARELTVEQVCEIVQSSPIAVEPDRDRSVRSRRYVSVVQRPVLHVVVHDRPVGQPGRLRAPVPVPIRSYRRVAAGRIFPRRRRACVR